MRPALFPALVGLAATSATYLLGFGATALEVDRQLALGGAAASVGSTMLGFMLAALAVLASINHVHLIQMMRKTGHYQDLLETLFAGSAAMLCCAVLGFALLFGLEPTRAIMAVLVGFHASALSSLIDTGRKFWLVLSHLRSD